MNKDVNALRARFNKEWHLLVVRKEDSTIVRPPELFNPKTMDIVFDMNYMPVAEEPNRKTVFSKPAAVAIGPVLNTKPFMCNYRSVNNHLRGLSKRVFHHQHCSSELLKKFANHVKHWCETHYKPLPHIELSHEYLDEHWLNNCPHYTQARKRNFHKYLDEVLQHKGDIFKFMKSNVHRYYEIASFIKREFYPEPKEPRIINARPDPFKAVVAPFIKDIEHGTIYNEHFVKGKTQDEVALRMLGIANLYHKIAETDYSSFEGSYVAEFQRVCELELFRFYLQNNPEIFEIIKFCYYGETKCVLKTSKHMKAHVKFEGSRMSGDMWTSLGNGFSNMMLFTFCAKLTMESKPLEEQLAMSFDYIVEGDDGFFGMNFDIDLSIVKELGFKLKLHETSDMNDLSFCSINLSPEGVPVPDFWRSIEKFGWSFKESIIDHYSDKPNREELKQIRAIGLSCLARSAGVPILQELGAQLIKLTDHIKTDNRYFDQYEMEKYKLNVVDPETKPITDATRMYFSKRFGIPVHRQLELEAFIRKQKTARFQLPLFRPREELCFAGPRNKIFE